MDLLFICMIYGATLDTLLPKHRFVTGMLSSSLLDYSLITCARSFLMLLLGLCMPYPLLTQQPQQSRCILWLVN